MKKQGVSVDDVWSLCALLENVKQVADEALMLEGMRKSPEGKTLNKVVKQAERVLERYRKMKEEESR